MAVCHCLPPGRRTACSAVSSRAGATRCALACASPDAGLTQSSQRPISGVWIIMISATWPPPHKSAHTHTAAQRNATRCPLLLAAKCRRNDTPADVSPHRRRRRQLAAHARLCLICCVQLLRGNVRTDAAPLGGALYVLSLSPLCRARKIECRTSDDATYSQETRPKAPALNFRRRRESGGSRAEELVGGQPSRPGGGGGCGDAVTLCYVAVAYHRRARGRLQGLSRALGLKCP